MNGKVFINCKKTLEFKRMDGKKFIAPKNYLGDVPEWVTETWLYKAACRDGTITFVGQQKSQIVVENKKEQRAPKQADANKAE